jgi:hypothetical protein
VKIALFKGKSFFPSRLIRWITRSDYSHAAFVFDEAAASLAGDMAAAGAIRRMRNWLPGACIEAWSGGVRCSPSISTLHTDQTPVDLFEFAHPLLEAQERQLILFLDGQIGKGYDYGDIVRFLTRQKGNPKGRWFCSELVAEGCRTVGRPLFRACEAWRVSPAWLAITLELEPCGSVVT